MQQPSSRLTHGHHGQSPACVVRGCHNRRRTCIANILARLDEQSSSCSNKRGGSTCSSSGLDDGPSSSCLANQGSPSQSSSSNGWMVLPSVAMHQLWMSLHMPAHAAESVSPAALVLFREFLDQITALGPWGGVLFVITVMMAEMVPLFPTQPLTLASGLIFGPAKGAFFVVLGVTLAAVNAFTLSRGVGRKLAEKVIAHEVGEGSGPVAQQLAAVNRAIEDGGFMRQVTAITLLRLTPVVPFSASNYLLGLTPVQLGPLVIGTVAGMSVWSILYASLGGASKVLLEGGAELDVLMEDLVDKAGQYSEDVAVCGLGLGLTAACYYLLAQRMQGTSQPSSSSSSSSLHHHTPTLEQTPEEVLQQK